MFAAKSKKDSEAVFFNPHIKQEETTSYGP
jgi:hypothetical protein